MSRERVLHPQRGAAQAALLIAAAIGLCVVLGTLWLQSEPPAERYSEPSVEYGRQLIRDTARNMGPAHEWLHDAQYERQGTGSGERSDALHGNVYQTAQ